MEVCIILGLFMLGAIFGSFYNNSAYHTQNNFSKYIPTYSIENWTPQIKMPKYDNFFSTLPKSIVKIPTNIK